MLLLMLMANIGNVGAAAGGLRLDELTVRSRETREFSFSDKNAGFFYGMTKTDCWNDGNAGWNIRAKCVFRDYALYVDGKMLDRSSSEMSMVPYELVRKYENATETFYLVDNHKVLFVEVTDVDGERLGIRLTGETVKGLKIAENTMLYTPDADKEEVVRIAALNEESALELSGDVVTSDASCGGFIIVYGTERESLDLVSLSREKRHQWVAERKARMQNLIADNRLATNDRTLDKSLAWIVLTADELVTQQHGGWGIYAGFPWFTDFWGRDMFISMPGIVLCTGQFAVARDILLSFAKYQDMDPKSPTYGRVPNRLNLDGILYNTTDGTPRFVMQVYDYLKYTGDRSFVKQIYNHVKVATDASINLYADEQGYLTHADADTWMDAKRQSQYPCSPRGNRAVDIQALWYGQLDAASKLADFMGRKDDAKRWRTIARKLHDNFEKDFIDAETGLIFDHINADGTKDRQLRPNTMYAYELISSDSVKMNDMRRIWENLVYPWGVASLSQDDNQFHPYHEQWHRYHKDDAYHNGTIWLWLNGQAMQRMIEYNQLIPAFRLFKNMNRQALREGAVGSLSECADAWCRPGAKWARRSGTFLQAWSNGEHIRVWNQYFLGVRPDMLKETIVIAPRLPKAIDDLDAQLCVGDGTLLYECRRFDKREYYSFEWTGSKAVDLAIDLPLFRNFEQQIVPGGKMEIETNGNCLTVNLVTPDGKMQTVVNQTGWDSEKQAFKKECTRLFKDTRFATPSYRENLKSMSRYFDPPLDYYSVE